MTKSSKDPKTEIKQLVKPKEDEGPSTNDLLSSLLKEHSDDHFNDIIPVNRLISTGSLKLDQYVKVRSGGVLRLTSRVPESGKSSESFVLAANFMTTMPKARTLYIKAEGRLSPEIQARSGLTFVTTGAEWRDNTVFVLSCNIFETVADFVIKLSKEMFDKGEHLCVIIDSLDGLILKADKEKGISGGLVAGVPKLTKLLFRHLALPITHYDILMLITGQYSADIVIDQYAQKVPRMGDSAGGSSLPHQCDYVLSYAPRYMSDNILEDENAKPDPVKNKIIGVWATIDIKKSATDTSGVRVRIPIKKDRVGCAIWIEKEIGDLVLQEGMAKRSGTWISFHESFVKKAADQDIVLKDKVQGINALYDYFEQDAGALAFFKAEIIALQNAMEPVKEDKS